MDRTIEDRRGDPPWRVAALLVVTLAFAPALVALLGVPDTGAAPDTFAGPIARAERRGGTDDAGPVGGERPDTVIDVARLDRVARLYRDRPAYDAPVTPRRADAR